VNSEYLNSYAHVSVSFELALCKDIPFQIKGLYLSMIAEMAISGDPPETCLSRFDREIVNEKVLEKCIRILQEYNLYPSGSDTDETEEIVQSIATVRKNAQTELINAIKEASFKRAGTEKNKSYLAGGYTNTWFAKQSGIIKNTIFKGAKKSEEITKIKNYWLELIPHYFEDAYWQTIALDISNLTRFARSFVQRQRVIDLSMVDNRRILRRVHVHRMDEDLIGNLMRVNAFKDDNIESCILYADKVPEDLMNKLIENKLIHGAAIHVQAIR